MLNTVFRGSFIRKSTAALLTAGVTAMALLLPTARVLAFTPNYNPSNLIDNPTLINTDTMTASSIQSFLSNVGSGIAGLSDVEACDSNMTAWYTHCGQRVSAAQIIYDAGKAYGVNPRAILATLEKEESLVTDPSPTSSQINCAMGYNSCANYVGFFTQVDWGTYTLRYNYEGAMGHSNWLIFHPAANYPCATAKSGFYSNGLFAGNTVTFDDAGGTAETITIANAATASLYCYTPYVRPISVTGYSGSYNFVYYYQLWFGSTQTTIPYAWSLDSQQAYLDSGRTQTFSDSAISIAPGSKAYIKVVARNNGYQTWSQSVVRLGTSSPQDRTSPFTDSSWLNAVRIQMQESSVIPGDVATYLFSLTAPSTTGSYKECFNLVAENITWMNDTGLCYNIDVVTPQTAPNSTNTGLDSGQSINVNQYLLSPDAHTVFIPQGDGNLVLYSNFVPLWYSSTFNKQAAKLIMQGDGNLVLYTKDNVALWDSETQGNPGAHLVLQTDGNAVVYSSGGTALWAASFSNPKVVHRPDYLDTVTHSVQNATMFPGQRLSTADGKYKLILQTDGNLVLYSPNHPLWATGTDGKPVRFLAIQGDGNMVLYDTNMNPLWYSRTAGMGISKLIMQDDGNLVLYNSTGKATWNTQTQWQL